MTNRMEGSSAPRAKANGPIAAPSSPTSSNIGPPLSPEDLDDGPQSSLTDVTQMWIIFVKTFAIILPIYIMGYFEFSFSWVLIGLAMLFYWRKNHGTKDYRINRALAYLDHEDKVLKQSVPTSDLPPWVSLPVLLQEFQASPLPWAFFHPA
ncbi:extended synaptotagmin-2-A [Notothenia coriiceps]|uniref:Extended synaptotagmin-2-A n=1 Tax=Notothenia coriiceps TaxID=8208 RepID=A0A6I9PF24_9TELE|nr:PREDICTED: extended synaptotagmin-2-A-like [Notothenia coriiceps]